MNRFFSLIPFFLLHSILCGQTFFKSQYEQDEYVYSNFFKETKKGFFIEIGAYDGRSISNTYFFEKALGWKGICIEPIPKAFNKLKKNRSCICINGCISNVPGVEKFLWITDGHDKWSGLVSKYSKTHFNRIQKMIKRDGSKTKILNVQCYRFMDIINTHKVRSIDYLSIDTEGGELEILKSIDFEQVDIDVIDVENNYRDPEFREFLQQKGYLFVTRLGVDDIYKRVRESHV